ncbi:MAG: poly-gamma-glutamate biosynthesis protein PgsC [candidate division WOR-3 bacterium]|nr:MAG: poly-gamma-glutamate biosynthesis protein PgsC [candidate division WOR-3 bacterium]
MVIETIGIGMLASFFLVETVGLAAGGIVVPGYFALLLHDPVRIVATLAVALSTWLILKLLARFMLVYGRRMLVLGILVGYLLGYVTRIVPTWTTDTFRLNIGVIGYVIPGLVAYWMERQGVVQTVASLMVAAVLTRLIVTVISGGVF